MTASDVIAAPGPGAMVEPVARPPVKRRIRTDAVWAEARKAWEGGETARSVARRYDVGVHALWKRREAEGWKRPDPEAGPLEPAEGWDRFAAARMAAFEMQRAEIRMVAFSLLAMIEGEIPAQLPTWHIGWLIAERARRRGPEVAEADRLWGQGRDWGSAVWDADGRMRPMIEIDWRLLALFRDDWREDQGLPPGAAVHWPNAVSLGMVSPENR